MANETGIGAGPGLDLSTRIRAKRAQVDAWLARMRPRKRRLLNTARCAESVAFLQGA